MVVIATLIGICEQKLIAITLLDREKNIKFLSFDGKSFFFCFWETLFYYLLGQMQWLYLGMNARLQCILPYRRRYKSRQC